MGKRTSLRVSGRVLTGGANEDRGLGRSVGDQSGYSTTKTPSCRTGTSRGRRFTLPSGVQETSPPRTGTPRTVHVTGPLEDSHVDCDGGPDHPGPTPVGTRPREVVGHRYRCGVGSSARTQEVRTPSVAPRLSPLGSQSESQARDQ